MKKKLLALAVAGAFIAPVAMADTANVQIYGQANVSFDSVDSASTTAGAGGSRNSKISSNVSRIGFKGSESLGGGTSAIWQIESLVNMDNSGTNGNGFGTRNTFAGLSGEGWGSLKLGRMDTMYNEATRRLDLFDETIADNRSLMGGVGFSAATLATIVAGNAVGATAAQIAAKTAAQNGLVGSVTSGMGFDTRPGDSVVYTSPTMSGFGVGLQYVAGSETKTSSTGTRGSAYSIDGTYNAGPIYVALAYQNNKIGAAGSGTMGGGSATIDSTESAWKLGGSYTMDQFQVVAAYERTKDDFNKPAGDEDMFGHHTWYLGGKFNVTGSDAIKLAYTKMNEINGGGATKNNTGAKQITVGYDHAMSKRTTVYALYTKLNNDNAAAYGLSNAGLTAESTGGTAATGLGADPTAFSIGMKHTF